MGLRRFLSIFVAVTAVVAVLSPSAAVAGNRLQPVMGDYNGDGLVDRATLGPDVGVPSGTKNCTIAVEYRNANGTFAPPVTVSYTSPWMRQPFCPNMGEAINLGPTGALEMVLTHFVMNDQPALLVLHAFQPVAQFNGMIMPSTIRSADFNGDGRTDIWESTDQSARLKTWLNTSVGSLVPGPIDVCSLDPIPRHVLADFNGDGGMDFLIVLRCVATNTVEARVLFGNGQAPVTLVSRPLLGNSMQVFQVDVNSDGIPDAGVIDRTSSGTTTRFFRNDGLGTFTEVLPLNAKAPRTFAPVIDQSAYAHH